LRAGAPEFVPGAVPLPEIPEVCPRVFDLQELSAQTVALRWGLPHRTPESADDETTEETASVCTSEASYFTTRWLPADLV